MDFRLTAFGHCFPAVQVKFRAFRLEIGLFQICLAGKAQRPQLLLPRERRSLGLQLGLFEFHVVLGHLQIVSRFNQLDLQRPVVKLAKDVAFVDRASFVLRHGDNDSIALGCNVHLMLYRKYTEDIVMLASRWPGGNFWRSNRGGSRSAAGVSGRGMGR